MLAHLCGRDLPAARPQVHCPEERLQPAAWRHGGEALPCSDGAYQQVRRRGGTPRACCLALLRTGCLDNHHLSATSPLPPPPPAYWAASHRCPQAVLGERPLASGVRPNAKFVPSPIITSTSVDSPLATHTTRRSRSIAVQERAGRRCRMPAAPAAPLRRCRTRVWRSQCPRGGVVVAGGGGRGAVPLPGVRACAITG